LSYTVKSFKVVDTKFRRLKMMGIFMETWICGFQILHITIKVKKSFVRILNLWIALLTKGTKFTVQRIKIISQYSRKRGIDDMSVCCVDSPQRQPPTFYSSSPSMETSSSTWSVGAGQFTSHKSKWFFTDSLPSI